MHSSRSRRTRGGGNRSVNERNEPSANLTLAARIALLNLNKKRAEEILVRARECRIVIVGDVMLDEFIWGDVTRISPEAPVPVVNIQRESTRLGGAANVLANVTALGARATVIGVVGNDDAAEKLRSALSQNGVQKDETLVCDDKRPTTIKTRI